MNLTNTYVNSENKELLDLYLTEAIKQGYTWCDGMPLGSLEESYAIVEGWVGIIPAQYTGVAFNLQRVAHPINLKELTLADFNIETTVKRKIIQITDVPDTQMSQGCLIALCNDGTVWFYQGVKWSPLKEQIPQDDFSTITKGE